MLIQVLLPLVLVTLLDRVRPTFLLDKDQEFALFLQSLTSHVPTARLPMHAMISHAAEII